MSGHCFMYFLFQLSVFVTSYHYRKTKKQKKPIKSINRVQKYPQLLNRMFALVLYKYLLKYFLLPMNFLISYWLCLISKLLKYVPFLVFTWNPIQWVPIDWYSSRFIIHAPSFISWINSIKVRFIFLILLDLKIS